MRRERIEDLGILSERLREIIDRNIFEFCESKHDFERWKSYLDNEDPLFDVHRSLRYLKETLYECYHIARGDDE